MSEKLFKQLVDEAVGKAKNITVAGLAEPLSLEYIETQKEVIKKLMSTSVEKRRVPISMKEALYSPDASILFPAVINDQLMKPVEPTMIGQTVLAKTVQVDNVRSMEFPTLGAIRAYDLGESQEYPTENLSFSEGRTEVKVTKSGVRVAISEDVINDSMWDILALHIEAGGYAMRRHKEEKIFNAFSEMAITVKDNSSSTSALHTSGVDWAGNGNGTLSFEDIIDAMGILITNEYVPTDIILHPLTWSIFMKDPKLQYQLLTRGAVPNAGFGEPGINNIQANIPWNITVNVTPFTYFSTTATLSNLASTADYTGPVSNIYICDRNNSVVVLQREPLSTEEFRNPARDILEMKFKERYGVGLLNGGRAAVALKYIRIADNYAPLFTVRTKSM